MATNNDITQPCKITTDLIENWETRLDNYYANLTGNLEAVKADTEARMKRCTARNSEKYNLKIGDRVSWIKRDYMSRMIGVGIGVIEAMAWDGVDIDEDVGSNLHGVGWKGIPMSSVTKV